MPHKKKNVNKESKTMYILVFKLKVYLLRNYMRCLSIIYKQQLYNDYTINI